jgi:hypothetical protein
MAPKVDAYADALGARRPKVSVREQTRRWGSCSQDGSIRMNARLMAFPEPLIDYVCAHEACHLKVMDHSPRFYALLDTIMPDHRERQRALREAVGDRRCVLERSIVTLARLHDEEGIELPPPFLRCFSRKKPHHPPPHRRIDAAGRISAYSC